MLIFLCIEQSCEMKQLKKINSRIVKKILNSNQRNSQYTRNINMHKNVFVDTIQRSNLLQSEILCFNHHRLTGTLE
jgi:hypothetical protein